MGEHQTKTKRKMKLQFTVERDEETGVFTACWDDPHGGGITTQGDTLEELLGNIPEAITCHFANRRAPKRASFSFSYHSELELQPA